MIKYYSICKWKTHHIAEKVTRHEWHRKRYGSSYISRDISASNEIIYSCLDTKEPCMIARFGSVELRAMMNFETNRRKNKKQEHALSRLCSNAGFFPYDYQFAYQFADLMKAACQEVDVLGVWNLPYEDYVVNRYMSKPALVRLNGLEPFFAEKPWTRILKGKKVLVIHPFEDTIRQQYAKRKSLFSNEEILPEFQLYAIKAVQTIAGQKDDRFQTWFEALEWMYAEAMKTDFDVALIGCGAYGFPLAYKIKTAGRQAIHVGGALQLFFGIKGRRWDNGPASQLYNDHWVRPSEGEKVKSANMIEGGCYW